MEITLANRDDRLDLFTHCSLPEQLKPIIRYLSGSTVGIYLIHAFLIEELGVSPLAPLFTWVQSPLGILLYACLIYGLSLALVTIIRRTLYFLHR